jgi:hypothetical protein
MRSSFDLRGLHCFASPTEAHSYYFWPKHPNLQRDANHRPMFTMVDLGVSGYLLFTATWAASESDLDTLRSELAIRNHEPDVDSIRLAFAPVTSPQCNALMGDGSGAFQTVATNKTSGVPPYDAVFNLFLQDERLMQAKAGLRGERGFLGIEYLADLLVPISAKAIFRSVASDLVPWLRSQSTGSDDIAHLLEQAVERGLAAVTIEVPDQQASGLAIELYNRVLAQAARVLPRWLEQDGQGDIHVAVTLERNGIEPIRAFADIAGIVSTESVRRVTGGQDAAN